jgi:hypothetical protein
MPHPLHEAIGDFIRQMALPNACVLALAPECGGPRNIPLFCSVQKSNHTEFCNADVLIAKNGKVGLIIEIEESGLLPTKICGKFLTSALSTHFTHDSPTAIHEEVVFIQILNSEKLKDRTAKIRQGLELERAIRSALAFPWTKIKQYHLFFFKGVADFQTNVEKRNKVGEIIQAACA